MHNLEKFAARHNFAARLQSLRKEKGLTQKQLATQLNTSVSSIIGYENAQRFPASAILSLLSQFFNVSKEYLLGETDERTPATTWEDTEIMEAVRESLPDQLVKLNAILKESSAQEQKHTFDILVELGHILKLEDPAQRTAGMALIQAVFAATTRYIDVCANAAKDINPQTRPQQARDTAMQSYAQALQKAFFIPE